MKKIIGIIMMVIIFLLSIFIGSKEVKAENEEAQLNSIKFTKTKIDIDTEREIPVTFDFTGTPAMITVVFENENGDKIGPNSIYKDGEKKTNFEIGEAQKAQVGTKYYLTDIYFMKKTDNGYETQKQFVTNKSETQANGSNIKELDYEYFFEVTSSIKLNSIKFTKTKIDIDTEREIPVTFDFTGTPAMITVVFENENGDKIGPNSIYIDGKKKANFEIGEAQKAQVGTKYYLTDVYFMKKTDNGYETQKQFVTNKSETQANGSDIIELDYEYFFEVTQSNLKEEKNNIINNNQISNDNTISKNIIPKAGRAKVILIFITIVSCIAISIILLNKYNELKNI